MATSVLDATMTPCAPQVIDLRTAAGGREYTDTVVITETTRNPFTGDPDPKDISLDTIRLALGPEGDDDLPGPWRTPDVDLAGQDSNGARAGVQNERAVALLIGTAYTPSDGTYWLYSQVGDAPETIVRRHFQLIVRGNS